MKTKLLVAGLACLSVVAVAQQSAGTEKPSSKGTSTGTAQSTSSSAGTGNKLQGKKGYDNYQGNKTSQDHWDAKLAAGTNTNQNGSASGNAGQATMVRESPTKASLSAVRESPSKGSLSSGHASPTKANTSVSAGDVNGDGRADKMATGKRQHQPMTVTKSVDKSSPK
jgi:hypothetical protein